ncbi:hypothetical protein ACFWR6_33615 [Streptomyces griseus]
MARTNAEPEKNWAQAQASGFTLPLNDRDFLRSVREAQAEP